MTIASAVYFEITPHNPPVGYAPGIPIGMSDYLVSGSRTFNMGFGAWTATFRPPDYDGQLVQLLEAHIREGDWVEYSVLREDGSLNTLKGVVGECRKQSTYDPETRAKTTVYTLSGYGWARALSTPFIIGANMKGNTVPAVERQNGLSTTDLNGTPDIPGIVGVSRWAELVGILLNLTYNPTGNVMVSGLRQLLELVLNDVWKNPAGESLIDRLSWARFGISRRYNTTSMPLGIPYRTTQIVQLGKMLTADAMLRQIACEAYNEIFYDYDDDNNPAIVFRPRYTTMNDSHRSESVKVDPEFITVVESSRTGAERFNYWRPGWAGGSYQGLEFAIDSNSGQSPIIDRDSIERYGLRPVVPQNDLIPPAELGFNLLDYHVQKIKEFRGWYYNNPEYITGTVMMRGIHPNLIKVGSYIEIPEGYWIRQGDLIWHEESFFGYVVDVTERFSFTESRAIVSNTMVTFVRGDAMNANSVPDSVPWIESMQAVESDVVSTFDETYASEHITWDDLKCQDGTQVPEDKRGNAKLLCYAVEAIMEQLNNTSIVITSAYRHASYNAGVDGRPLSQHIFAKALDFSLTGVTPQDLYDAIEALITDGLIPEGGLGLYPTFVHYDIRGSRQRWDDSDTRQDK